MDWMQVIVFFIGNAAIVVPLWLWQRAESRADSRSMLNIVLAIQAEMKDFHGRLCAIEEKYRSQK